MPKTQVQPLVQTPVQTPSPATITPALLKQHSITPDEYARIEAALGRTPSLTELGIFSVMWSEHCSYKSSRVHLKRLPTRGERKTGPGSVVQGPGENAGIIDVGTGGHVRSRLSRTIILPTSSLIRVRLRVWVGFCGIFLR